jgi:S1-C subfamily serine protease
MTPRRPSALGPLCGLVLLLALAALAWPQVAPFDEMRYGIAHVGAQTSDDEPRWLGTGFLVDQDCTFVTAKHVLSSLKEPEKLIIRFENPGQAGRVNTVGARILHRDPDTDLAFLVVQVEDGRSCSSGSLQVFALAPTIPDSTHVGSAVAIIGFPRLAQEDSVDIPVMRKGHLSSVQIRKEGQPALLLDLFGVPGFSGSPVVLETTGAVIGVVYGPGPTRRAFGFEWATPIDKQKYTTAMEASEE